MVDRADNYKTCKIKLIRLLTDDEKTIELLRNMQGYAFFKALALLNEKTFVGYNVDFSFENDITIPENIKDHLDLEILALNYFLEKCYINKGFKVSYDNLNLCRKDASKFKGMKFIDEYKTSILIKGKTYDLKECIRLCKEKRFDKNIIDFVKKHYMLEWNL